MCKFKLTKGITLIALIITIIILLILAGVTIVTLTGENGILNNATQAVEKSKISEAIEEIKLAIMEEQINAETGENLGNKFNYENVWKTLKITETQYDTTNKCYYIIYKGYKFKIDENKIVTYLIKVDNSGEQEGTETPVTPENPGGDDSTEEPQEPEETTYTITYNKNDGTEVKEEVIVEIGVETTLDTEKFTKDGYKIEGWYTSAECTGEKVQTTTTTIEIYAKWEELTTIESVGGTTIGTTTYTESYEIWNKTQLQDFRDKVNGGKTFSNCIIKQKVDIDLNSESWTPIGDKNTSIAFSGTYDADGRKITNLKIDTTTFYQGLFSYVKSGTVQNLTIDGNVKGGSGTAGLVACVEDGIIDNCTNNAYITHADNYIQKVFDNQYWTFIGGISGLAEGTTQITNSSNNGIIETYSTGANVLSSGGIVGLISENENGVNVKNCSNNNEIKISKIDKSTVYGINGGIVGAALGGNVKHCYNTVAIYSIENDNITDFNTSGGIVGYSQKLSNSSNCIIEECWNNGNIENTVSGGIVGINYTGYTIKNSYNIGNIMSNYKCGSSNDKSPVAGGICAWNLDGLVMNCYNKGDVEGNGCYYNSNSSIIQGIGGVVGCNNSNIQNVFNCGQIKAYPLITDQNGIVAGGIVGLDYNISISYTYNIGNLLATEDTKTYLGGICGWVKDSSKSVSQVYNIGQVSENALYKGGLAGIFDESSSWSNTYWIENKGATSNSGNYDLASIGKCTEAQIKSLVADGNLSSTNWVTNSNINNGYPYLSVFDDTSIWLRDSNGDLYLKNNPPQ